MLKKWKKYKQNRKYNTYIHLIFKASHVRHQWKYWLWITVSLNTSDYKNHKGLKQSIKGKKVELGLVADPVIKAIARLEFDDGLRTGFFPGGSYYPPT